MTAVFSDPLRKKIESYLTRYETLRSAVLPVLHAIQDEHGWVSPEQIEELHSAYKLDRIWVKEVITFYDIYKDHPTRKFVLRFCDHMTCRILGSKERILRTRVGADGIARDDRTVVTDRVCGTGCAA